MRQYIQDYDFGRSEEHFNTILYNREKRYQLVNFDFDTDIFPLLMKNKVDYFCNTVKNIFFINEEHKIGLCAQILTILQQCYYCNIKFNNLIDIDRLQDKISSARYSKKSYQILLASQTKHSDKLVQAFVENELCNIFVIDNDDEIDDTILNKISILRFFIWTNGQYAVFKTLKHFSAQIEYLRQFAFNLLIEAIGIKNIYFSIQEPKEDNDNILNKTPNGIRVLDNCIIFEGFDFTPNNAKNSLYELLEINDEFINAICFRDCQFTNISISNTPGRLIFQHCVFEKKFDLLGCIQHHVEFDNCIMRGEFRIAQINLKDTYIWTHHCFFENESNLTIENIRSDGYDDKIIIENSQLKGEMILNYIKDIDIILKYITFLSSFTTKDIKLGRNSIIKNICVATNEDLKIKHSRQNLYHLLVENKFEQTALEQNILPQGMTDKKQKFDNKTAYLAALETGFLKSEYAAYFLNKSPSYLSKKRMLDRKKITRESIPYIGEGKDIQYPVDALTAFKQQDWNTLKELRKKYKSKEDK